VLGIGGAEFIIIALFVLIVFGPDKLPEIGRTIGAVIRQFNRAKDDMERIVRAEMMAADTERPKSPYAPQVPEWYSALTKSSASEELEDEDEEEEEEDEGIPAVPGEKTDETPSPDDTATIGAVVTDESDDDEEEDGE
jgi:TatA/E family protein of Tat protein translocase